MTYWPWWAGGLALGAIATIFFAFEKRLLGVSGSFEQVVRGVFGGESERDANEALKLIHDEDVDLAAMMMAATMAAAEASDITVDDLNRAGEAKGEAGEPKKEKARMAISPPLSVHATFVAMVVVGGLAAALVSGQWSVQLSLGSVFEQVVATGPVAFFILFAGGMMVGFGTRMSGGCTSGHGLCGSATVQPASFLATAAFFGSGVALSFGLAALAGTL